MSGIRKGNISEKEILERMGRGDRAAFDLLYATYWESAYSAAFKRLRDAEVCRDIVQDVFLQLWLRRETLMITNLPAYLYTAIRNRVFKCMYKQQRFTPLPELLEELLTAQDQSDAVLIRKEFWAFYEAWIDTLTPAQQEIFKMRYHEDLSTIEIADRLHITRKTVQNQLGKSVAQLRQSLGLLLIIQIIKYWES